MSARTWHSGPPPFCGWWNASTSRDLTSWRWWNGRNWSVGAYPSDSAEYAARQALRESDRLYEIEWADYYPKNARVPRIDPAAAAIKQYLETSVLAPAKKVGKS